MAVAMLIGGSVGLVTARKIQMTAMPQLVAAFHSLVGMAAVLVGAAAYLNPEAFGIAVRITPIASPSIINIYPVSRIEMGLGVAIGAITFSGSVIAFLKLNGFGPRGHDGHRARLGDHSLQPLRQLGDLRVAGDPVLQRPRLADVKHIAARILHAVHARPHWQRLPYFADRRDSGVGRLLLVEALGSSRVVGTVGRGSVHASDLVIRRACCET
jgi:hypothetical protein